MKKEKAVLIYDAACPVCSRTALWIEKNQQQDSFELLPCGEEEFALRFPHIQQTACMRAMHLVLPDGAVLVGEKALPDIFKRLKRYRVVASLLSLPGVEPMSRLFYRWFAVRRYAFARLFHIQALKK